MYDNMKGLLPQHSTKTMGRWWAHNLHPTYIYERTETTEESLADQFVDIPTTVMVDFGKELAVPSYLFFPSCMVFLGQLMHFSTTTM
ncbi:hypothetical protein LINPERPRIM_LOCUS25399, partial [Linum perenne]